MALIPGVFEIDIAAPADRCPNCHTPIKVVCKALLEHIERLAVIAKQLNEENKTLKLKLLKEGKN